MFHFGLPSEPLDHSISPPKQISRYNKLMYIGPLHDPLPLPVAKKAIYVDWMPRFWQNPSCKCEKYGKYDCNMRLLLTNLVISTIIRYKAVFMTLGFVASITSGTFLMRFAKIVTNFMIKMTVLTGWTGFFIDITSLFASSVTKTSVIFRTMTIRLTFLPT